jgi:hypothetical protein
MSPKSIEIISFRENFVLLDAIKRTMDALSRSIKQLDSDENIKLTAQFLLVATSRFETTMLNAKDYVTVLRKLEDCCNNKRPPRQEFELFIQMMKEGEETAGYFNQLYLKIKSYSPAQGTLVPGELETNKNNVH